jgi:hypothetical protein
MTPDVAHSDDLHRHVPGSKLRHVHMAFTPRSTAKLTQTDAIVRAQNTSVRASVHSNRKRRQAGLLYECAAVNSLTGFVLHLCRSPSLLTFPQIRCIRP